MNQFTVIKSIASVSALLAVVTLTGCQTLKETLRPKKALNNHSLDYTQAKKLPPVQLPVETQTLAFVPMYNVPEAGENTLSIKNPKGKNYQLMRPHEIKIDSPVVNPVTSPATSSTTP